MSDKQGRQHAIRTLIAERPVASQDALRRLLARQGWQVTQSTLSRDLRELRLARIPDADGRPRYASPADDAGAPTSGSGRGARRATDPRLGRLERMLPELLVGIEGVDHLVVVRTVKSGAQPVAEALDQLDWKDVAGTIAGDDTVLIICRSHAGRARVVKRLGTYRPV